MSYGASAAFSITLASLGNSTTAGQQSTVINNASSLYSDVLVGGQIRAATNTLGAVIEVYAFAPFDDTPLFPDVLGTTNAAVTFTSRDAVFESMRQIAIIVCEGTANRKHWIPPVSIARVFGSMPYKFGVCVINSSGGALHATGSDHFLYYKGR